MNVIWIHVIRRKMREKIALWIQSSKRSCNNKKQTPAELLFLSSQSVSYPCMKQVLSVLSECFLVVIQPFLHCLSCSSFSTSTHTCVHTHAIVFHLKRQKEKKYFWFILRF